MCGIHDIIFSWLSAPNGINFHKGKKRTTSRMVGVCIPGGWRPFAAGGFEKGELDSDTRSECAAGTAIARAQREE